MTGSWNGQGMRSVEVIREDGTICSLPDLPETRRQHVQLGLVACGGQDTRSSCVTFNNGAWTTSHTLSDQRRNLVGWTTDEGLLLIGGAHAKTDCCDSSVLMSRVSNNNGHGPVRIIFTFSGLCLDQLGGTCLPKRQPKIISHQVVFYDVNGTQVCLRLSSGAGGNIL